MSFQFNFTIEEAESSSTECELDLESHLYSPDNVKKEISNTDKLLVENSEEQPVLTGAVNETKLMISSSKTYNDCSSSDSLAEEMPARTEPATEHKIPVDVSRVLENKILESVSGLQFVNVSVVEMTLSDKDSLSDSVVSKSIKSNSDLIPGVYEGGMKIWECTFDLIKYFDEEGVYFEGKRVLDLGCGAGLLGIEALKRKAKEVHFQDYNSTVIEEITIPNVLANCDSDNCNEYIKEEPDRKKYKKKDEKTGLLAKCRFFSGEWSQFRKLMQNETPPVTYDIILTSETIYNTSYYRTLHETFENLLTKNGIVYLATKSHYFGVGGGVHLFETYVRERKVFCTKTLKIYDDGLQRFLINLSLKNNLQE
ncbi:histidine protein methyltransferase 1 homolog [Bombina bombina]|uniref:histidine protein methyltransferase 1 homolog n=1 Tax=Bombina bombina TaxID=8345 RepID=UPI00235AF51A|nr:histidine protein methyltransferase 1 homolog [Bombina bombina]XP_053563917.1 histidine protein methyltransferase 1 homolog [Bombina bombina]